MIRITIELDLKGDEEIRSNDLEALLHEVAVTADIEPWRLDSFRIKQERWDASS